MPKGPNYVPGAYIFAQVDPLPTPSRLDEAPTALPAVEYTSSIPDTEQNSVQDLASGNPELSAIDEDEDEDDNLNSSEVLTPVLALESISSGSEDSFVGGGEETASEAMRHQEREYYDQQYDGNTVVSNANLEIRHADEFRATIGEEPVREVDEARELHIRRMRSFITGETIGAEEAFPDATMDESGRTLHPSMLPWRGLPRPDEEDEMSSDDLSELNSQVPPPTSSTISTDSWAPHRDRDSSTLPTSQRPTYATHGPDLHELVTSVFLPTAQPSSHSDTVARVFSIPSSDTSLSLTDFTDFHIQPVLPTHPSYPSPNAICAICKEVYEGSHAPMLIVNCNGCRGHIFGYQCLRDWITSGMANANQCPLCRTMWFKMRKIEMRALARSGVAQRAREQREGGDTEREHEEQTPQLRDGSVTPVRPPRARHSPPRPRRSHAPAATPTLPISAPGTQAQQASSAPRNPRPGSRAAHVLSVLDAITQRIGELPPSMQVNTEAAWREASDEQFDEGSVAFLEAILAALPDREGETRHGDEESWVGRTSRWVRSFWA